MSRFKLPTPPSRRKSPADDGWRTNLPLLVETFVNGLTEDGLTEGWLIRDKVIQCARVALSDRTSNSLADQVRKDYAATGRNQLNVETMPSVIRALVERESPNWDDPFQIESVMLVIQRALDEAFTQRIESAARVLVSITWFQDGRPNRGQRQPILDKVMEHARQAIDFIKADPKGTLGEGHRKDKGDGSGPWVSPAEVFRSMLSGLDLADPERRRAMLDRIEQEGRSELSRAVPGSSR